MREVDAEEADEDDEEREARDEREHHRLLLARRLAACACERGVLLLELLVEIVGALVEGRRELGSVGVLILDLHLHEVGVLLTLVDERLALRDDLLALLGDLAGSCGRGTRP